MVNWSTLEEPLCEIDSELLSKQWLIDAFEKEFVTPYLYQASIIDEIDSGESTIEEVMKVIYSHYEKWANEYIESMEESRILNYE